MYFLGNKLVTERVEHLYAKLNKVLDPSTFVLNKEAESIIAEIAEIQAKCHHVYKDGICTVCLMEREKE